MVYTGVRKLKYTTRHLVAAVGISRCKEKKPLLHSRHGLLKIYSFFFKMPQQIKWLYASMNGRLNQIISWVYAIKTPPLPLLHIIFHDTEIAAWYFILSPVFIIFVRHLTASSVDIAWNKVIVYSIVVMQINT